ncbi:MAG: biopolymer transporter ExbD [Verrucomicrobiota bacterium]
MRIKRQDETGLDIQMAPLIDCMFILLIFFLVTTTLKKYEPEVPLELPFADAAVNMPVAPDLIVLAVDASGQKYINGRRVSTTEMLNYLQAAGETNPNPRVRIDGDQATDYRHIVELVEACKFNGLTNVGLHTRPGN